MRIFDASAIIERAKATQGFKLDQDLAEFLGVSRTSLASWKVRNSIPAKHLFAMIVGTDKSIDWLTSGLEEVFENEHGFAKGKPYVDPHVLWLALIEYKMHLQQGDKDDQDRARELNDKVLSYMHLWVGDSITKMMDAKARWEASGIIHSKDIYKAIATEFGLGLFEFPPTPWWENDEIV